MWDKVAERGTADDELEDHWSDGAANDHVAERPSSLCIRESKVTKKQACLLVSLIAAVLVGTFVLVVGSIVSWRERPLREQRPDLAGGYYYRIDDDKNVALYSDGVPVCQDLTLGGNVTLPLRCSRYGNVTCCPGDFGDVCAPSEKLGNMTVCTEGGS